MSIQHSIDGGVVTNIETIAQNETEQEISYTSPTVKLMDRVYYEILEANKAIINDLTANTITTEYLTANFTKIFQANIENGAITNAMIGTEAVKTSQIADGSITDAKIVELTANKIKAGTLDVERLIVTQNNQKYLFHINEDGTTEYQKLNGNILEDRSITADKIVANAITANEIATATITANEIAANTITSAEIKSGSIKAVDIDVANLFAQNITASGTISGLTLKGTKLDISNAIQFYNGSSHFGEIKITSSDSFGVTSKFLNIYADDNLFLGCSNEVRIDSNYVVLSSDKGYLEGEWTINGKFNIGSSYYIKNGEGYFDKLDAFNLYENGTALSNKYLSNSQLKSCLVTDSNSKSISCSSNGGTGSTTVSMTKNGYTLLGCVGIEVSGTASTLCNIVEFSVSGSGIYVRYRNMHETSSSQTDTWTLTTYGLYIKN